MPAYSYAFAMKKILILGGGFAGVTAAMELTKKNLPDTQITLLGNKSWLEYHTIFYRLLGGKRPAEACLPLGIILPKSVHIVTDKVTGIDPKDKVVAGAGGKAYDYDVLIVALGAQPAYFGIPGMQERSMTMKSAAEALEIRDWIDRRVREMKTGDEAHKRKMGYFAVIGAGPTGIEIASVGLTHARKIAKKIGADPSLITFDLIEAADRLLPVLHPNISQAVTDKLKSMGVNVLTQKAVTAVDDAGLHFKDGETKDPGTILWTAGVKPNDLLAQIPGIELDKRGRAVVDEQLRAKNMQDVFVIGDCASTQYSGMAQTALEHGAFVAQVIETGGKKTPPVYRPAEPAYAIPVGISWGAVQIKKLRIYGLLGMALRRGADLHAYMLLLPIWRVPLVFFGLTNLDAHAVPNPPKAPHL